MIDTFTNQITLTAPSTGIYFLTIGLYFLPTSYTFESDPYVCPYQEGYEDVNQVFKACKFARLVTTTKTNVFNSPPHTDSQPRFDMKYRVTQEVIKIRLDFPDVPGTIKPFKLRLLNESDGLPLSIQPAPFNTDISGTTGGFY